MHVSVPESQLPPSPGQTTDPLVVLISVVVPAKAGANPESARDMARAPTKIGTLALNGRTKSAFRYLTLVKTGISEVKPEFMPVRPAKAHEAVYQLELQRIPERRPQGRVAKQVRQLAKGWNDLVRVR